MQHTNQYMVKGCKPVLTQPNASALGKDGGTYLYTQRDALSWDRMGLQPILSNLLK